MGYLIGFILFCVAFKWTVDGITKHFTQKKQPETPQLSAAEIARIQRERERIEKAERSRAAQAERERIKAEKELFERQQAAADVEHLTSHIDTLYKLLWAADAQLQKAQATVDHDAEANKHGAVVSEKIANKNIDHRDRLQKRVLMLENSIHAAEKKLIKAQYIITQ